MSGGYHLQMVWWILLGLLVLILVVLGILLLFKRSSELPLALIQQQLKSLNDELHRTISETTNKTNQEIGRLHQRVDDRLKDAASIVQVTQQTVGARIDKNTEIFGQVQQRLGSLEEAYKRIESVGANIAELQDILKAPKLRGNLGEQGLEELLAQILPRPHFEMQYSFKNGERVDAVIKLSGDYLVPVDAKFPYENFKKMLLPNLSENEEKNYRKAFLGDFKRHIDEVAKKYIRPEEGTLPFSLLYVPAENIYYEAILRDDRFGESLGINSYALQKRVIPVSPNSLYAYLQAIVLGLKGLRIEEKAKEIFQFLHRIRDDLSKLDEEFQLVGKHLMNAHSAFDKSEKRLERVRGRVDTLEGTEPQEENVKILPYSSHV